MQPNYELNAELFGPQGWRKNADRFLARYGSLAIDERTIYGFRNKAVALEALQFLQELGLEGNLQISFEYAEGEIAEYPAFSLVAFGEYDVIINGQVNSKVASQYDIVKDYNSEALVTSLRFKTLVEGEVPGTVWKPLRSRDGNQYFRLEILNSLPEPVYIPEPREITESVIPGVFSVSTDGRYIITPQNLVALQAYQLAYSMAYLANGSVYTKVPSLVATGKILHRLITNHITGFDLPAHPLLTEDNPLSR